MANEWLSPEELDAKAKRERRETAIRVAAVGLGLVESAFIPGIGQVAAGAVGGIVAYSVARNRDVSGRGRVGLAATAAVVTASLPIAAVIGVGALTDEPQLTDEYLHAGAVTLRETGHAINEVLHVFGELFPSGSSDAFAPGSSGASRIRAVGAPSDEPVTDAVLAIPTHVLPDLRTSQDTGRSSTEGNGVTY